MSRKKIEKEKIRNIKIKQNMKGFRNIYAPMVQNSGLSSLLKKKLVLSKGLKYVKWTTHWAQKSGLTLSFEHVT